MTLFSPSKTVSMHFTKLHGLFPESDLKMGNDAGRHIREVKFLGLILDCKLTYAPHIKDLRKRYLHAVQIMKCLSHMKWGAGRPTLL